MKKLIVITSPYFFKGEDSILSHLFDEGMQHLHLRKPDSEANELRKLLDRIPDIYYPKVVLHDCFNLAIEYGLGGIHLNQTVLQAQSAVHAIRSRNSNSSGNSTICFLARFFKAYPKKVMGTVSSRKHSDRLPMPGSSMIKS